MLSDRRQIVLRVLIEEYIAKALPVGSRTLVERYNLGYSAATIRNDLSLLEEAGYLQQPHTSAGRIPTDTGYRAFVDELLGNMKEHEVDENVLSQIKAEASELDELFEKTSKTLSRLTNCLAMVVPPRILSLKIKLINLISLSDYRLLMVVVTEDGQVFDRQVTLPEAYSDDEINRCQNLLNSKLNNVDLNVSSIIEVLGAATAQGELGKNKLFRILLSELHHCLEHESVIKPRSLGMSNLMLQPEFRNSDQLLPVLTQLEDDTMLLQVLDETTKSEAPLVRIGSENHTESLSGVSLVATRFGEGDQMGLVAIVGPTRMNYSRVFKAVKAAKSVLQDI